MGTRAAYLPSIKMRLLLVSVFAVVAVFSAVEARPDKRETFHGDKVISAVPKDDKQLLILQDLLHDEELALDFWQEPVAVDIEVGFRVPAAIVDDVVARLNKAGVETTEAIGNLQEAVDFQELSNAAATFSTRGSIVGKYAQLWEIHRWIDQLVAQNPGRVFPFSAGKSYHGKPLKGVKIGKSAPGKPAFWFHAGIHAREWVATASCIYILDLLVNSKDPEIVKLTSEMVWYVVPVMNPDGYEYTFKADRMWRKTRTPHNSFCPGADPNRNWDSAFGTTGVSRNPCTDIYPGPYAFSEPCTKSASETIMSLRHEIKGYVSFHSFSQLWLTPWAYTKKVPDDFEDLMAVATEATSRVMKRHHTSWKVGPPSHILYSASGGAFDWVKSKAGVKYAYTLECRPNTMNPGFLLPASGIIPSGEETWEGVKYVAQFILKTYGPK